MSRLVHVFLLLVACACKPKHSCEQPGAPVELQLLTAAQPVLNPDEDGSPWATNVRIYELKTGVDLQNLEFEAVYRDREKAFGEAFVRAHDYAIYPNRHTRWTFKLSPDTAHVVTVGLFRRPFGDAWYQVYDVPADHAVRRCEAEARGDALPDPCVYLAFERSEIDGGAFPPAGFELATFEALCAPVVHDTAEPKNKKKRRKGKLPTVPTVPQTPSTPRAPASARRSAGAHRPASARDAGPDLGRCRMTIATAIRPVWSEGMLMCPQHMQQQDLYHEQHLEARLHALSPTPWGVLDVHFDLPALHAGNLQLADFRGVLPDGTPLRFDAMSSLRPAARPIAPHFPARATAVPVYLGLPLLREGIANYSLSGEAASPRFRGVTRRIFDLTLARNEREVQGSEPAPTLLFEGETGKDHATLRIGELVRDAAGGFALADNFIPPCLALHAAPGLGRELHDLLGSALARRRRLAEERRGRDGTKVDLTLRELEKSLFLHALDRSLAWLRHCADTPELHPQTLYHALLDLTGALMTVAHEGDPGDLPSFRYTDLRATFTPLLAELRRLLGREFEPMCIEVPLTIYKTNSWVGQFQDERLLHCKSFVLAVEIPGDLVTAANEIPQVTKIASWERIGKIVQLSALGVPLRATFQPPPEIPGQPRTVYFILDTSDQLWHELVAARKIAIYPRAPYEPQRARCRLFAVPTREQ